MNSPRIRHLVQPSMSVADRNLSVTGEVRIIMTTTALPLDTMQLHGIERLISLFAVWLMRRSQRRVARQHLSHDEMAILRRAQADSVKARDLSQLSRLG
jgi:hypothetical protein